MSRRRNGPGAAAVASVPAEVWEAYLEAVGEHGTKQLCARRLGIGWRVLLARMEEDVAFRQEVEHAMELCADRLEEQLIAAETSKVQVVGMIVRLKALRPRQYIERQVAMQVNVHADVAVSPEDARAMLADLVRHAQPRTVQMLMQGPGQGQRLGG